MPTGWNPGDPTPTRPAFVSDGHPGYWLWAKHGGYAGDSGLRFYYLDISEYVNGLAITGEWVTDGAGYRTTADDGLNGNLIQGMKFHHLGTTHNSSGPGYAAIKLENSSGNVIKYNHVQYAENPTATQNLIHAVYLAHGSSDNDVYGNNVKYVTGHPFNLRNDSNFNDVHDNVFTRTGWSGAAYYDEWFCDTDCLTTHSTHPRECPSWENWFRDNELVSGYDPATPWIPAFLLQPAGNTYTGGTGCTAAGTVRIHTSGNVRP